MRWLRTIISRKEKLDRIHVSRNPNRVRITCPNCGSTAASVKSDNPSQKLWHCFACGKGGTLPS